MKAEIPFTFRVGDAVLAPGSYQISVGSLVVRLLNTDTKQSSLLVARYRSDVDKHWAGGAPKLLFSCVGSNCVLSTLWNGSDPTALVTGSSAPAGRAVAEMRVVNMSYVRTE